MSKISGPLLDRIDIHLDVPVLASGELLSQNTAETSQSIKARTTKSRSMQQQRFNRTIIFANAQMNHQQIKSFCSLNDKAK